MDNHNLIIKHNKLIEAQGRLTALEQKFVVGVIAQVNAEDESFKEYEITINEMINIFGIDQTNVYRVVDETIKSIMDKHVCIREDKEVLHTRLFSSVKYIKGQGTVKFWFDPNLKPYLLQLSAHFTKYELKNILKLKSTHSIRIYELLKQYQTIKKRKFTVGELKKYLGIKNEYLRFYDFERYVLKVTKKEINATTDLFITYRKIKVGRKIGEIEFEIERRYSKKDLEYANAKMLCEITNFKTRELVEKSSLIEFKINEKQFMDIYSIACEMTEKFSLDPCEYIKINYEHMKEKNDIVNPIAYLKIILKNDGAGARIKMLGL